MDAPRKHSLFHSAHWMLLGLVLALGFSFYLGSTKFGKKIEDTFSDPHRQAALETFEQAIEFAVPGKAYPVPTASVLREKFPQAGTDALDSLAADLQSLGVKLKALSPASKPLRFDLGRWHPAGNSPRAHEEAFAAAHWLVQGQRLEKLDWPGLRRAKSASLMQVPDSVFQQDNPWRGADGCVYLRPASGSGWQYLDERRSSKEICPAMAPPDTGKTQIAGISRNAGVMGKDDPAWGIPNDLGLLLGGLDRIRSPSGTAYQIYTRQPEADEATDTPKPHGPNRIRLRGRERDVGFNVYLTFNPATQALAQRWARCYTGDRAVCDDLGLDKKDPLRSLSAEMYESAPMRMAAVAVVDVASGRIEALGSAHTPCYKQDHSGIVHGSECPDAPFRPRYDTDRLYNHALYMDAMPASTIKPIMALAFLLDNPVYRSGQPLQDLWHDLKTSNSADFLDRLFCGDGVSAQKWRWQDCHRPQKTQEVANALGWNLGCASKDSTDCARLDVLFGRPSGRWPVEGARPMGLDLLYGRLLTELPVRDHDANAPVHDWAKDDAEDTASGFRLIQAFRFDESFAKSCSRGDFCPECPAKHKRWRRCRGVGGTLANEGWGQGEARAIPLAVAGMLSRLADAANGAKTQAFPHLVDHVGDAQGQPLALAVERYAAPEPINIEPDLAKLVLQGMTSHQTGGTADDACKNAFGAAAVCDRIDWIAGKTGTPPFRFDGKGDTLAEIRRICYANDGKPKIECNLMPFKWYVAAFKTSAEPNAPYDKAIAVLSERNWRVKNGLVQAPGDAEVNLSAELALRVIKTLHPPVVAQAAPAKPKVKP